MRKDLPSIYALPIDKDLRNNKELYYSSLKDQETEYKSPGEITKKINEIFARKDFVYKKRF